MPKEDGRRTFALRDTKGNESSVFAARRPRRAAKKAAKQEVDPNGQSETEAVEDGSGEILRLRERGTDKIHVYEAWTWTTESDTDYLPDKVTESKVQKIGTEKAQQA